MTKRNIRILGLDPGLSVTGWNLSDYDTTTGKLNVIKFGDIVGKNSLKHHKNLLGVFEKQHIILHDFEHIFVELIKDTLPDYVCFESPFLHRFPNSYATLMLVVHTMRRAAHQVLVQDIHPIAPRECKLNISNSADSDKVAVQQAVLSHNDIVVKDTKQNPTDKMSQHAADSIGVTYTFAIKYLPSILASSHIPK